ncbi:hypothetical protein HA402_011863 [Bradysia odoriphaga]|nr:hypothetical protein HA402_011863 [Bradysia odoriphaga]
MYKIKKKIDKEKGDDLKQRLDDIILHNAYINIHISMEKERDREIYYIELRSFVFRLTVCETRSARQRRLLLAIGLEQYASVNPIHAENLRKKAQFQEKKRAIYTNRVEFMVLVNAVDSVLSEIEAELEKNELTNTWLCCDQITIADISLAVLLQRLYSLGFEEYFWMQKRPHLRQYFTKISAR